MVTNIEGVGEEAWFQSASIMSPTLGRCVSFWILADRSSPPLKVYWTPISIDGSPQFGRNEVWNYHTGSFATPGKWVEASFWYSTKHHHRLQFMAQNTAGTGYPGIAIDDIVITDGACACRPFSGTVCTQIPYKSPQHHHTFNGCSFFVFKFNFLNLKI